MALAEQVPHGAIRVSVDALLSVCDERQGEGDDDMVCERRHGLRVWRKAAKVVVVVVVITAGKGRWLKYARGGTCPCAKMCMPLRAHGHVFGKFVLMGTID